MSALLPHDLVSSSSSLSLNWATSPVCVASDSDPASIAVPSIESSLLFDASGLATPYSRAEELDWLVFVSSSGNCSADDDPSFDL